MSKSLLIVLVSGFAALLALAVAPNDAFAQGACGNGICSGTETCSSCPADCGDCPPVCGSNGCEIGETCSNCVADCGDCPFCGDGTCNGTETCLSCEADCGTCGTCGDGTCDSLEDCSTCEADCGACGACGDGTCDGAAGESCSTCAADCGACCGDGTCDSGGGEDCLSCAADCGACSAGCGNGTCDPDETCQSCASDCGQCLNDFASCPFDLPACTGDVNDCCYRDFQPVGLNRPLIIPLDRCHQSLTSATNFGPPTAPNAFCRDPDPASAWDLGMVKSYGLIYRLMQNDIPVYWLINPTKEPPRLKSSQQLSTQNYSDRDIDLWALSAGASPPALGGAIADCVAPCVPPVLRINPSTMTAIAGSYTGQQVPFRGGAFVIAGEDRARFNQFMTRTGDFAGFAGNALYDFSAVTMYEVQNDTQLAYQDFRTAAPNYALFNGGTSAPVAATIDYDPPRLARQNPAAVSSLWLADAQLDEPAAYPECLTGEFTPSTAVYCDVTNADIQAGYLVTGRFDWAWMDNWTEVTNCTSPAASTQMAQFEDFMTAVPGVKNGNSIMFMGSAVTSAEQCTDREPLGNSGGLTPNPTAVAEPLIIRHPANLFNQWGDVPSVFAAGATSSNWNYSSNGYRNLSSLVRLVGKDVSSGSNVLCTDHRSSTTCDVYDQSTGDTADVLAYGRYRDEDANGIAFYMGGRNVTQNSATSHLRALLNAFIAVPIGNVNSLPESETIFEIARSSPVVSTVDGITAIYQGAVSVVQPPRTVTTFRGANDADTFRFPHFDGSMNAVDISNVSDTATSFDDLFKVFNAADGIPTPNPAGCATPFTSTCRTVFTTVTTGDNTDPKADSRPTPVFFDQSNKDVLGPILSSGRGSSFTDAELDILISRVLAGRDDDNDGVYEPELGGVDRSTVAVIGRSPIAGTSDRPTMVYFGGLDGMIHAVCAEVIGECAAKGQELWAYIPRTQLRRLRDNIQRIDGSSTVIDAFGDFDGDGGSEWRTVMTIQMGSGGAGFNDLAPAVIAFDITDPFEPVVLWEKVSNTPRTQFEMGVGLRNIMGPVIIGRSIKYLTIAQTNNGGIGGAGFIVRAINTVTGADVWQFQHAFPAARTAANPRPPSTGIPGGISGVDETGAAATITHVFAPSIYGELFMIDARTGLNQHGTKPIFSFTEDFRPIGAQPTVFVDQRANSSTLGKTMVLAVSGGYADPVSTTWSPDTAEQFAVGFPILQNTNNLPLTEATVGSFGGFAISLGVGNRAFASATVAGSELLIITDSTDINSGTFGLGGATGSLARYSLTSADSPSLIQGGISVAGGAGSAESSGAVVLAGSGGGLQKLDLPDFDNNGAAVELIAGLNRTTRLVWLRLR